MRFVPQCLEAILGHAEASAQQHLNQAYAENGERLPIDIKVIAYTFPAICIVMGALLLGVGAQYKLPDLVTWGGNLIIIGAALQAMYLFLRYGKKFFQD